MEAVCAATDYITRNNFLAIVGLLASNGFPCRFWPARNTPPLVVNRCYHPTRFVIWTLLCLALPLGVRSGIGATGAGPDGFGYTAASTTFAFEDLTLPSFPSTGILDRTDDSTVTVPIGFPFAYYGIYYTTVTVSTNGLVTFGGADASYTPVNISTTITPSDLPTICPFWHDWTFQYAGSDEALYSTLGTPGNRRLVVQWDFAISRSGSGYDTVTFQLKLFEGSNNIEFHYNDATVSDDPSNSRGQNATVGIRDTHGQQSLTNHSLQWSYNQNTLRDQTAIRYTAPQFEVNSVSRLVNKDIFLDCTGAPSIGNKIQYSPDLTTRFQQLGNPITADSNGHFTFEDLNSGTVTRRFYRIGLP